MMSSLNLPTLEQRRNNAKLTIMYKALNGSLCVPTDDFVPITAHQGKDTSISFRLWLTLINFHFTLL